MVDDAGRGGHQVQVKLPLQPLLDDLHVQQAQKPAAEAVAQRHRRLRVKGEGGVVHAQLLQRVAQVVVIRAVGGVDAAEHHRRDLAIAGQGLVGRARRVGDGVAHAGVGHVLDGGGDVAHVAGIERVAGRIAGAERANLHHVKLAPRLHQAHAHAGRHGALHHAHKADRAAVVVIEGVEDQRLQGRAFVARGRGNVLDDGLQHVPAVFARLGGDERRLGSVQPDHVLDFLFHFFGPCGGQVNLVDDGNGLQIVLQRHVDVGQRLRLDALRGVHHQQCALAGRQRAADLIAEVHVAGGVDEVEGVGLAVQRRVLHAHGLGLDGDAALALQLHGVENLLDHLALFKNTRHLQQAVGQRALAVVDVGDDAEVADMAQPVCVQKNPSKTSGIQHSLSYRIRRENASISRAYAQDHRCGARSQDSAQSYQTGVRSSHFRQISSAAALPSGLSPSDSRAGQASGEREER